MLQEIEVDTAASIDHKRKLAIAAQQSWAQQTFAARVKVIKAFQATLAGLVQHERGTANMVAQHAPLLAVLQTMPSRSPISLSMKSAHLARSLSTAVAEPPRHPLHKHELIFAVVVIPEAR